MQKRPEAASTLFFSCAYAVAIRNYFVFRSDKTLARAAKMGDLFVQAEELKQKLPKKWKLYV
jgi:hypothetical protein